MFESGRSEREDELTSCASQYNRCRDAVYDLSEQSDKTRFHIAKRIISEARDA